MSKVIKVKRFYNQNEMAQTDESVKEWLDSAYKAIGPYWESGKKEPASGLSTKEIKLLMPYVHNVEQDDRDFKQATKLWFTENIVRVPPSGLKLEVGLQDSDEELSEDNLPINIKEYVQYRHLSNHPDVAKNEKEAASLPYKKFFIFDKQESVVDKYKLSNLEDEAAQIYFSIKSSPAKVEQVLTLLGDKPREMDKKEKNMALKDKFDVNPKMSEASQTRKLKKFIEVATNKDIELEYMIAELISAQVLESVSGSILIKATSDSLGDSMREAVQFLKNSRNSKTLVALKREFNTLVKDNTAVPIEVGEEAIKSKNSKTKTKP